METRIGNATVSTDEFVESTEKSEESSAQQFDAAKSGQVEDPALAKKPLNKTDEGEPAEATRRKDAEAFPTPRSSSGGFDPSRRSQELDQNMMQQPVMGITTLMISQIPEQTDAESFRRQLDSWGLNGTYNFFYMPPDVSEGSGGRCVFINFIDQAMAKKCMSAFQQCPMAGVATPYNVQGLENNIADCQFVGAGDMVNGPLIVPTPTPSAWALNGAQDLDSLRQEAAQTLLKAAQNGTLEAVLSKKPGQDMDQLRSEAARLLLRAAEDGTLEAVLSNKAQEQEQRREKAEIMTVKMQLHNALEDGIESGKVKELLTQIASEKPPPALAEQAGGWITPSTANDDWMGGIGVAGVVGAIQASNGHGAEMAGGPAAVDMSDVFVQRRAVSDPEDWMRGTGSAASAPDEMDAVRQDNVMNDDWWSAESTMVRHRALGELSPREPYWFGLETEACKMAEEKALDALSSYTSEGSAQFLEPEQEEGATHSGQNQAVCAAQWPRLLEKDSSDRRWGDVYQECEEQVVQNLRAVIAEKDSEIQALKAKLQNLEKKLIEAQGFLDEINSMGGKLKRLEAKIEQMEEEKAQLTRTTSKEAKLEGIRRTWSKMTVDFDGSREDCPLLADLSEDIILAYGSHTPGVAVQDATYNLQAPTRWGRSRKWEPAD